MAPRHGDASMATCLHRTGDDLRKVLAELQASGSMYFRKTLVRRGYRRFSQCTKLGLPACFIKEHGDKFEKWVILRTLSSNRPWRVRLSVEKNPITGSPSVKFNGGWSKFAGANRLKEGDSLIFALNGDARSEFQVYIFRGVTGMPGTPQNARTSCRRKLRRLAGDGKITRDDLLNGKNSMNTEKTQINLGGSSSVSESNLVQASETLTSRQWKGLAPQCGADSKPSFRRQLIAFTEKNPLHRMEVPARFVKAHGMPEQLQDVVELQGVHQESPVRVVACQWIRQSENTMRLYFVSGWLEFAKENGLKFGDERYNTTSCRLWDSDDFGVHENLVWTRGDHMT